MGDNDSFTQEELDQLLNDVDNAASNKPQDPKGVHVFSQDEIKELLNKVHANDKKEPQDTGAETRPDKYSREQLVAISRILRKFAALAMDSLSEKLRTDVSITVSSVDHLWMEEYLLTSPAPTTIALISMEPLKGSAILEIIPSITTAIINKICHGKLESSNTWHEFTRIEKNVMESIYACLLENLREAWSELTDLQPRLDKMESDPSFIRLCPPKESVALVTLETKFAEVAGMMVFVIPYPVIEPIADKLS